MTPKRCHLAQLDSSPHRSKFVTPDSRDFLAFHMSSLTRYPKKPVTIQPTSARVQVPARVNDKAVEALTIDSASDLPIISLKFIRSHSTLDTADIKPVPSGSLDLRSADGSPIKVVGFIRFNLTLGKKTLPVEAFVLRDLGPDNMLIDNSVMGAFRGILDWETETLSFHNSDVSIKATHKRRVGQSNPSHKSHDSCSVVRIETTAQLVPIFLKKKCVVPPQSEMALQVESEEPPEVTTTAVIEPRIITEQDAQSADTPQSFRRLIVARTVTEWTTDKKAIVQVANPSQRLVRLDRNTLLGYITPVAETRKVKTTNTSSAVTENNQDPKDTREELERAFKNAFTCSTFSEEQKQQVLDLCVEYRSVFSLKREELGCCTLGEATFPLQPGTQPVDRQPYRANPRVQEAIDKCVDEMERDGIIEQRASPWGSAVTIVTKADGTPRFCVDYRSTLNKSLVRKSWPMPQMESHIDTVAGAKYLSVFDVRNAFFQVPIRDRREQAKTAFVTSKGKWVFKRLPFGLASSPFIFSRIMALTFAHFGPKSGLLVYMDDLIACSSSWESHLTLLKDIFKALQAAGLTLKPSKAQFGPKEVEYLGHTLSADGIKPSDDRIKAILDLPRPTNIKQLRSFLGMVNFVRKFIPRVAEVTAPLVDLTKKKQSRKWENVGDRNMTKLSQK